MNELNLELLAKQALRSKGNATEQQVTAAFQLLGPNNQIDLVDQYKAGKLDLNLAEAYCKAHPEARTYMFAQHQQGDLQLPIRNILLIPEFEAHNEILDAWAETYDARKESLDYERGRREIELSTDYWTNRIASTINLKESWLEPQSSRWSHACWPELNQRMMSDEEITTLRGMIYRRLGERDSRNNTDYPRFQIHQLVVTEGDVEGRETEFSEPLICVEELDQEFYEFILPPKRTFFLSHRSPFVENDLTRSGQDKIKTSDTILRARYAIDQLHTLLEK